MAAHGFDVCGGGADGQQGTSNLRRCSEKKGAACCEKRGRAYARMKRLDAPVHHLRVHASEIVKAAAQTRDIAKQQHAATQQWGCKHRRVLSVAGNVRDCDAAFAEGLSRATRGEDGDTEFVAQCAGEFDQSALVGHGNDGAANFDEGRHIVTI